MLTLEQLAAYERDGFLVLEDFVADAECERLRARAGELVAAFEPGDALSFFFEEGAFDASGRLRKEKERALNKIGHALHDLDPVFDRFSRTPALAALVRSLGTERPLLLQSMYVFKQPEIGGEVTCHQDATFLYTEPLSVTGFWFALEDATRENGCMWALAGGHKLGLKSRFVRADGGGTRFEVFADGEWPDERLVPLEVKRGALVVLHGLLPHLSRVNRSRRSRHAYTLHVIGGRCRYPEDNWLRRAPSLPLRGFE
jgi:phytanoyl-CoA hydroxylase